MAKYFTWCLKRSFVHTNPLNLNFHSTPILRASNYVKGNYVPEKPVTKLTNVDTLEPRDLVKFEEDAQANVKYATLHLAKIFKTTQKKAATMLQENPQLKHTTVKTLYKNFDLLRRTGVTDEALKKNVFLLAESTDKRQMQIDVIQSMGLDVNDAAAFFHLEIHDLEHFRDKLEKDKSCIPNSNRLLYLSEKLNQNMETICNLIIYHTHLMTLPLQKIKNVTEYLLEIGVAPEHICSDLSVYARSLHAIKTAMQRAKSLGVKPLKPWYTRCTPKTWHALEQKYANPDGEQYDPAISKEEYFSQIFKCSIEVANYFIHKDKRLRMMSKNKFVTNAKLIEGFGFPLSEVIVAKVALMNSTETLTKRLAQWKELGLQRKPRLWFFALNHEEYNQHYKKACEEANKIVPES